jgi:hypothetical protein
VNFSFGNTMRSLISIVVLIALVGGCASPTRPIARVRPGDSLLIKFTVGSCPDIRVVVDADGNIEPVPLSTLHVGGMTLDEIRQKFEVAYGRCWPRGQKVLITLCP